MSISSLLSRGRNAWLATATDVCRITRTAVDGDDEFVAQVINDTTLQYPAQGRVTVYEGPCRMQVKVDINSNVVETTAGDKEWTYLVSQLQLPVLTPTGHAAYVAGDPADVDVDNVCELLTSPEAPALVGAKFNISGPFHKSQAVYLRFRVKEPVG